MSPTEFAALAVIQLLAFTRLLQATKGAWGFIPPAYQWLPATLLTGATEIVAKLQTGVHSWLDVAIPVVLVLSTVLPGARSNVHAALQGLADKAADDDDNPIHASTVEKVTRGSLPVSRAATGLTTIVFALAALCLAGCDSAAQSHPPAQTGAQAAELVKSVHAGAVLGVRVLDQVNSAWVDSVKTPTNAQLDVMQKTTGALAKARDILNKSADVEREVRDAGKQLLVVVHALDSMGVDIPPELVPVLKLLEGYVEVGGDS